MKAGADAARAILKLLQGEKLEYQEKAAKDGAIFSRFDQCVSVWKQSELRKFRMIGEIASIVQDYRGIIFDLDDTLYLEKDYVRSGYQAVGRCLPEIDDAGNQLWDAFQHGQRAIDHVLRKAGIYSEERKTQCLEAYRSHMPTIELLPGVKELLHQIRNQGIKIGIITDGRPEGQRAKIAALGLEVMVDEIIITDELAGNSDPVRFRKPNDIAFRIMKDRLNIPYSSMVYVGDNVNKDFMAPLQLGMGAIWFQNKDGLYWKEG